VITDFLAFAEGPLLWIVFALFGTGLFLRTVFFILSIIRRRPTLEPHSAFNASPFLLLRLLLPFHNAIVKKPLFALLRYAFHICLFVVPIWFSSHIILWDESRFEWYWTPIPDEWADAMTLILLGLCCYFLLRRIIFSNIRRNTSIGDYLFIILTALPFLTGYFLTHGSLDHIDFFKTYMWYFHVLSAEAMLVMMVFLFCRTRLTAEKCIGCAACEINCPTGTLETTDIQDRRVFTYSHYQCICCGTCVGVCPENAAELRHEVNFAHIFRIFTKRPIRNVELAICESCGLPIGPRPQMRKLQEVMAASDVEVETLNCCSRCKKTTAQKSHLFPDTWQLPAGGQEEGSRPAQ
jgi:NAD-dependent dihydropyrimidine dehydrogenase PreA subunit/nitrate reductase gamma subunit